MAAPTATLYVPLGDSCAAAFLLRHVGLRAAALPLDWVLSPTDALLACVEDDFARQLCEPRVTDTRTRGPRSAIEDAYGFRYLHDFPKSAPLPTNTPAAATGGGWVRDAPADGDGAWQEGAAVDDAWEAALPEVRAKYARRVARLRDALGAPHARAVLVRWGGDMRQEQARALLATLRARYPTLHARFVALHVRGVESEAGSIVAVPNDGAPLAFDATQRVLARAAVGVEQEARAAAGAEQEARAAAGVEHEAHEAAGAEHEARAAGTATVAPCH